MSLLSASMQSTRWCAKSPPQVPLLAATAYAAFAFVGFLVFHFVAEGEFSAIMTISIIVQCLGVAFLCLQVLTSRSAAGISAGSLMLDACAFTFRLSSTTWLDGYLPVDASGDYVFQAVDVCSLAMVLWLLHQVLVVLRPTYQQDNDEFAVGKVLVACLCMAGLLHGDNNSSPLFDILWMASLFIGVLSVLPQLWLVSRAGGTMEALTGHWIAALTLSRVLSGYFMWVARNDITCSPWVEGYSHAIWAILCAHLLHIVLLADFLYCYARAVLRRGFAEPLQLTSSEEWV
jgi:ER lumen protein retaining receptor